MSRHTITIRGRPRYVIGFDRPVGEFFIQVYNRRGDFVGSETLWDPEADLPVLLGPGLPPGLVDTLLAEAAGVSDTNAVKTWPPPAAA